MKNTTIILIIILLIVGVGAFVFTGQSQNEEYSKTDSVIIDGDIQKITLSFKNYNYHPNTIKVKEGIPVEITLDQSVFGCYRAFVIREFGVNTYSRTPEEKITFTPNKKGKFQFACSMGMGYGTLIVE